MKFNFDYEIDRRKTDSLKWDQAMVKAPMWVADMDFEVAPCIQEVIHSRAEHNVYGYTLLPNRFYTSIQKWWLKRHGIGFEKNSMQYVTGVLPAINVLIQRFTIPGENVLVMSPVYHMFYHLIERNGRNVQLNPLLYINGSYVIDYKDLEEKLSNAKTTMMILCNPHNPTGNLWDKADLERIGNLCEKYGVLVISDEIHADIVQPGYSYMPYAKVNDTCFNNSITLVSATKAFNIPGLSSACAIIPNPSLCAKAKSAFAQAMITNTDYFSAHASIAAFEKGEEWLDAMNAYVAENKKVAAEFIRESISELEPIPSNATYLLWIDFSKVTDDVDGVCDLLKNKEGIYLSKGSEFGPGGQHFVRMNVALPRQQLLENLLSLRGGLHTRTMRRFLEGK